MSKCATDPTNNCYNYATDRMVGNFCQPGQFKYPQGCRSPNSTAEYLSLLRLDGLKECSKDYQSRDQEIKIALFIFSKAPSQFHFYRQDKNEKWSHKMGPNDVSNLDASGKLIVDPEKSDRKNYDKLVGYFVVNNSWTFDPSLQFNLLLIKRPHLYKIINRNLLFGPVIQFVLSSALMFVGFIAWFVYLFKL